MRHYVMSSVFVILAGSAAADIVSTPRTLNDYGYVQDVNLDNYSGEHESGGEFCQLNNQSCVPTSWTNSLVYLQNKYGIDLAGLEIAGSDYNAWADTVVTLRSPKYMNTSQGPPGTTPYGQVHGVEQFLIDQGAGPLATSYQAIGASFMLNPPKPFPQDPTDFTYPDWLMLGAPVLAQLNQWLEADAAVVIDVLWGWEEGNHYENGEPVPQDQWGTPNNQGHALALVGVSWTDKNNNHMIDRGEAYLDVIDPLNPTLGHYTDDGYQPVGPARITQMDVWQHDPLTEPIASPSIFGLLNISYNQYKADCGQPYPFADSFPNGNPTFGETTGWLGGAGALKIIGGPGGSCCLVTGCDVLTEAHCGELGGSWALSGSCDDCPEYCEGDTNNDGYVNMDDLLSMLGNWGACP